MFASLVVEIGNPRSDGIELAAPPYLLPFSDI
jgi:hypothetical protein